MGHGNGTVMEVSENEKKNGAPQGIAPNTGRILFNLSGYLNAFCKSNQ